MNAAVLAAFGASAGFGVATVLQAIGARRSRGGLRAFASPLVLGGLALDGVSGLLSLVAQARLPLFLVQTIVAAQIVVVVLAAPRALGVAWRGRDVVTSLVAVASLAVLALAAGPEEPGRSGALLPVLAGGAIVLILTTAAAYRRGPGWLMAGCSALGYSGAAIGVRAARFTGSLTHVAFQPAVAVIVVTAVVGVVAYMRALERAAVGMVAATGSVIEVVLPGAVGLRLLHDTVRPGWGTAAAVACVVALACCIVLAFSPASAASEADDAEAVSP